MAAKKKVETVADQPTAAPSRKMEGVIAGVAPGAALGSIIVWALGPDGAGLNVPGHIETAIVTVFTAGAMLLAGYFRRERAEVAPVP